MDTISTKQWYDYYKLLLNPNIEPAGGKSANFSEFVASYIVCHDNTCVYCDSNKNDHQNKLLKQLNRPIHESEIREQIDRAKRGKSPGEDGILNELLKPAKEKFIPILKMLFNTIFDYSVFPSSWHLGIITSIFKKGRRNNPSNYRGVSYLSNLGKVLTGILNTRIVRWVEEKFILSESQAGFRKGRSAVDHIFVLKTILDQFLTRKKRHILLSFCRFLEGI